MRGEFQILSYLRTGKCLHFDFTALLVAFEFAHQPPNGMGLDLYIVGDIRKRNSITQRVPDDADLHD